MSSSGAPCGACKFLRRKCVRGCIFAPYFTADQGAARFAAVHKIFGASNVGKLLHHIPLGKRVDAVLTISYEAQARLSDPVYGCVATIFALQQQVASLQAELAMVQAQLASRLAMAAAFQQHQQEQQQMEQMEQMASAPGAVAGATSSYEQAGGGMQGAPGPSVLASMAASSSSECYGNRVNDEAAAAAAAAAAYHHRQGLRLQQQQQELQQHSYDPGHSHVHGHGHSHGLRHGHHHQQISHLVQDHIPSSPPEDMDTGSLPKPHSSDSMDHQSGEDCSDLQALAHALLTRSK